VAAMSIELIDHGPGIWTAHDKYLDLIGTGTTRLKALEDLIEFIKSIKNELSSTPDKELTDDAIVLRYKLWTYTTAEMKP